MVRYIESPEFKATYGSHHYVIPKRLNQDIVESFFSVQRQSCGGSNNMTAYTYGYNVNSTISHQVAKTVARKETNVFQGDVDDLCQVNQENSLPKRVNVDGIFSHLWAVEI